MTQHTPGPWTMTNQPRFGGRQRNIVGGPAQIDVATAQGHDADVAEANARLIAAAPETAAERDRLKAINAELLGALKRLCDQVEAQPEESAVLVPTGAVRRGRAAIAKAQPTEGETQL